MVRTKKIKKHFYGLLLVLITASCGSKNYGSVYYSGKTQVSIDNLETTEYDYLNSLLGTSSFEDSVQHEIDTVPGLSSEEIALNEAIDAILLIQNTGHTKDSLFDFRTESAEFHHTTQPVLNDSTLTELTVNESIVLHDTIPSHDSTSIQSKSIVNEPFPARDTIRSIVYDSVRVQLFDTITQTLSVTTVDTIRKTVEIENQQSPNKTVVNNKYKPTERDSDKRNKKSTTIVPVIIPAAKKEKTDTARVAVAPIDSTLQTKDSLLQKQDSNLVIVPSTKTLADSIYKSDSEIKMRQLQDKIDQLELKIHVDNSIILAKLDDLMRMRSDEKKPIEKETPIPSVIIKTVEKKIEVKPEQKKLTFYYLIAKTHPENESNLIDEIVAYANQHNAYKISLSSYTDASGSAATNFRLSKERATSIREQLISKGLDERNIFIQYFGKKYAVKANPDAQRKVECLIEIQP